MYRTDLGRFFSPDPIIIYSKKYSELSTNQFASNTPIQAIDLDGLEALNATTYITANNGSVLVLQMANPFGTIRGNPFVSLSGTWAIPNSTTNLNYSASDRVKKIYGYG